MERKQEVLNVQVTADAMGGGKRLSAYLSDGFLNLYSDAMMVEIVSRLSERLADEVMEEARATLKPVLTRKLKMLAELL